MVQEKFGKAFKEGATARARGLVVRVDTPLTFNKKIMNQVDKSHGFLQGRQHPKIKSMQLRGDKMQQNSCLMLYSKNRANKL